MRHRAVEIKADAALRLPVFLEKETIGNRLRDAGLSRRSKSASLFAPIVGIHPPAIRRPVLFLRNQSPGTAAVPGLCSSFPTKSLTDVIVEQGQGAGADGGGEPRRGAGRAQVGGDGDPRP